MDGTNVNFDQVRKECSKWMQRVDKGRCPGYGTFNDATMVRCSIILDLTSELSRIPPAPFRTEQILIILRIFSLLNSAPSST